MAKPKSKKSGKKPLRGAKYSAPKGGKKKTNTRRGNR